MGWYLNGQIRPHLVNASVIYHFVTALGKTDVLEDKINQLWLLENEGLEGHTWSDEDKSVMELWNQECRLIDGHYELPIPWKDRNDPLPNNYFVAKSRLDSLMKRLKRQDLVDRYQIEINKLLDNDYTEVVTHNKIHTARRVWYLPHHAVITEKKPDKLRVVFDCASRYGGKSLNGRRKQGPNLINNLLHVLLRFRLHKFAFHADIKEMYNQVKIPIKDRDALRFLWYKNGRVLCMRMTSHLFGEIWCSSSSSFALRRTPVDCDYASPYVKDTVEKAFYVDDCLKSVSKKDDARMIIRDTPRVLRYGGFNLTKFIVNDLSILSDIPEELRAKEVKDLCPKAVGKVSGVQWNISDDTFFFTVKINVGQLVTRRNMLSMVSSVFDPLGLAGPLVVSGKLLFQEATRLKLGWDDPVPVTLEKQWTSWIQSLLSMNVIGLRDARCVKPEGFDDAVIELHHFADARKLAYGSCSYLRCVNKLGLLHTSLVVSKSKIAPLKQCTIPRLELQAEVLAAKVDKMLREELDIVIDRSYFSVDSEIVLKYINNDSRRLHVFVGNRVSMIRQFSSPCQWNFIPGKLNSADALNRGQALANLDQDIWFGGPSFLREYKENWFQVKCSNELVADDPEVRTKPVNLVSNIVGASGWEDQLSRISNYFSSWNKLKRIVAWWLRLIWVCLLRAPVKEVLSIKEVRKAEILLIKHVQQQHFSDEIARLLTGASVAKSSPLRLLIPFIDQDGLLRVGGRLIECKSIETRPYILSHLHPVPKAIVNDVHCKAHVGVEWTHSLVRHRYWILKARPLIKRLMHNCVTCRKLYGKPCTQFMGNLPLERIEPNKPPFAYFGIDLFGPFYVKLNRSEVKRYGCMVTCLVTRELHIEKLNSLDTEAFINGLRRFISRRGCPEKIFSDHGTNFVGAEAELKREVRKLSKEELARYAVQQNFEWHFIPPSAAHMGGAWERMIGCTKRVMKGLLSGDVRLTDEILETVFAEAEFIINGRPLTKLSDDPEDPSPLTPNHLLLLRENPIFPMEKFDKGDKYKRRWKHVQHLADVFLRKWVMMYLPQLQKRVKWVDKQRNLNVGDLVLIADENTPRNIWPLGLVKLVNKGKDGLVRSVCVKTRSAELVLPITKIVLLEGASMP